MTFLTLIKKPSAYLPIVMSIVALTIVLVHLATSGVAREADEGTAAHLWQILITAQLPVVAFFAFRWLPRSSGSSLPVLALQMAALMAAVAPVYLLNL